MNTSSSTQPRVILLDIEGTTTPIDFVYQVLFPFARHRLRAFLSEHRTDDDTRADIEQLTAENARDIEQGLSPPPIQTDSDQAHSDSVAAYAAWLMDQDRKATPLKSLQGRIWEAGYRAGELRSQLFADVPPAFARWREAGRDICIYSSGSVLAQRLLFSHSEAGDLTHFIRDYFDTYIGAKRDAASYRRIAASLDCPAAEIVFVSDVVAELDAARTAGFATRLCIRPGNPPQPPSSHKAIRTFDELMINRQDAKTAKKREPDAELDHLAQLVIGAAIEVHRTLGPGFLESVYEEALCIELSLRGVPFTRQAGFNVNYRGQEVGQGRVDVLIAGKLIVELIAVEALAPVHMAQTISYLKMTGCALGLLINFNVPILKNGIRRVVLS